MRSASCLSCRSADIKGSRNILSGRRQRLPPSGISGADNRMSTLQDVCPEIERRELEIASVRAKITAVEAEIKEVKDEIKDAKSTTRKNTQRLPGLEKKEQILREELVELHKEKNILLGKGGGSSNASHPESALKLLHWGYKNVLIASSSLASHKRPYNGDCKLIRLNLKEFCDIAKAKLHDVTSGVTFAAGDAMRMRAAATDAEDAAFGTTTPVTTEAELNVRFGVVVGKGVADVVNACISQKQPTWDNVLFQVEGRPSEGSGRPDFLIKQTGDDEEVDVCGGEGKMPGVMRDGVFKLSNMQGAVADALMQACSYCEEKGWRFTFITSYRFTFFIWRVAKNKYAVTTGILHDAKVFDLYVRELLTYIIWMSLEAPWGNRLPAGKLQELEVKLQGRAPKAVLHGRPKEQQGQDKTGKRRSCTPSRTSGKKHRQQAIAAPNDAVQTTRKLASQVPVQDAPEYPLASLQLSSIRLGAGQCGSVVQGRLWGVPVAVKVTDACKSPDMVELLWHEARIYEFLWELQGHLLPVLHGCGYWRGRNSFFLATSVVAGKPISNYSDVVVGQAIAQGAQQALQAIHQRGVAHGDVRADNILLHYCGSKPKVIIIDFGHAYLDPTPEQCEREMAELAQVLHELEWLC